MLFRSTKDAKERSAQSRIADVITSFSGRMVFVYVHIAWFGLWILLNTGRFRMQVFDPFPYGLLSMVVAVEAIFLSTFVLIRQNCRAVATERRADLEMETTPEDVLAEIHRLQALESSKG